MIKYLEDGYKIPIKHKHGIDTHFKEISKEEYFRLERLPLGLINHEVEEGLDDSIIYGYGFYGAHLECIDGRYYVAIRIGNSCD